METVIKWLGIAFLWLVGLILYNMRYHPYRTKRDLREAFKWLFGKLSKLCKQCNICKHSKHNKQ